MKKNIALFCSLILLLSSCSSDNNYNPPTDDSSQIVLTKKIINKNLNDNSIVNITEFEYNGNKISKSISQSNKILYTYNGDLITNIKIYDLNDTLLSEYLYSYQNNNLVETIYKILTSNVCEKRLYTYNANQTVNYIYYQGDLLTQNTLYKTGVITIQNEEVVSIIGQDYINSVSRNSTFTYDNQNNPSKNIIGIDKLKVELDRVGGVFKNNISNSTVYNNSQYFNTDFTYVYNLNGYPVTANYFFNGINFKNEYFY
ncbi:MAG: hypothetical protein H7239_14820 [Flavobacterium sp.]|nr:hypothetical protein [Flavobacterium sp.]